MILRIRPLFFSGKLLYPPTTLDIANQILQTDIVCNYRPMRKSFGETRMIWPALFSSTMLWIGSRSSLSCKLEDSTALLVSALVECSLIHLRRRMKRLQQEIWKGNMHRHSSCMQRVQEDRNRGHSFQSVLVYSKKFSGFFGIGCFGWLATVRSICSFLPSKWVIQKHTKSCLTYF